jgi:hypothetical protein
MTDAPTIETSDDITALAKALPKAQAAITAVGLDKVNDHFSNRYASLSEIAAAILPAMNGAGITVLQPISAAGDAVTVTTMLIHETGQWLRSTHVVPVSRRDAQGVGSAVTYARRQALAALLTVAPAGEDDDGEGAVGRGRAAKPPLGGDTPKEPAKASLAARTARLEGTLRDVKTLRDLTKAWDLAKGLRDELHKETPADAARMDALHDERHAQLIGGAG